MSSTKGKAPTLAGDEALDETQSTTKGNHMNIIALNADQPKTMSSLELVEIINEFREDGKPELLHKNFLVKVEGHPGIRSADFLADLPDSYGRPRKGYNLPKRECELMVMSESLAVQARVYDRMVELESQTQQQPTFAIPQNFVEALRLAADMADGKAKAELEAAQKTKLLELAEPKVKALDQIATFGNGSYCVREAAKILDMQEKRLRQKLQEIHWIYHPPVGGNWLGYAPAREKGYVEHKRTEGEKPDGTRWESVQVRITDKGLTKLAIMLQPELLAA